MLKVGNKIKVHMYSGRTEIHTRNLGKIFTVGMENGKLGIDWNENLFSPFNEFSHTVIFEDMENGKRYRYGTISNQLEEVSR